MTEKQYYSTGTKWEPIVGYSRAIRAGDQVFVTGRDAGSNSVAGSTLFVGKAGQVGPDGKIGRLMAFR